MENEGVSDRHCLKYICWKLNLPRFFPTSPEPLLCVVLLFFIYSLCCVRSWSHVYGEWKRVILRYLYFCSVIVKTHSLTLQTRYGFYVANTSFSVNPQPISVCVVKIFFFPLHPSILVRLNTSEMIQFL